jgi:hypothetical protein
MGQVAEKVDRYAGGKVVQRTKEGPTTNSFRVRTKIEVGDVRVAIEADCFWGTTTLKKVVVRDRGGVRGVLNFEPANDWGHGDLRVIDVGSGNRKCLGTLYTQGAGKDVALSVAKSVLPGHSDLEQIGGQAPNVLADFVKGKLRR